LKQQLVIVSAPRSGVDALITVLTTDPNWIKSTELHEFATGGSSEAPAELGEINSELSNEVELHFQGELGLHIPEIAAQYPTAKFVHLTRLPAEGIRSALIGWRSKKFITKHDLPGWWGDSWSFPLVPNWEDLIGLPIPEVTSNQWFTIAEQIIFDLKQLPAERWMAISYEEFLLETATAIEKISTNFGLSWNGKLTKVPISHATDGISSPKIFNRASGEVAEALNTFPARVKNYQEFRTNHVSVNLIEQYREAILEVIKDDNKPAELTLASTGTPFSYQHSASFYEILHSFKSSLAVSTYKSGHLIFVRSDEETTKLNCAFKSFNKPMGIALSGNRFALGTMDSLDTFTNQAALSKLVKTDRINDALFFPRASVNTGDVAIHEMAYGILNGESKLWFINTKFSCLSTLSLDYSFEPVWQPEWITELAPEDRCHLNGLAMVNGKPKYVSALAQTNTQHGWRSLKGTSGLIIDIETNEIVAEGLSMPHSPRWYKNELWILESGKGALAKVNPYSGEVTTIATLPGFTRGLAFVDKFAFIGLSQVRESVFSELPVTKTKDERNCGIWIVDITNGNIVGVLRFDGMVQEIFDVAFMPNMVWPKIETTTELTQSAYVLSDKALKQVKVTSTAAVNKSNEE
jgi:uncharacterized protein (TIGR03032 family)